MMGPAGVTAVASRIRAIQTMVNSDTGSAEVTFDVTQAIADAGSGDFEPFGAVYQAAVASTALAQPAASTLPTTYGRMLDSIGPRALGVGATATVSSMAPLGVSTGVASGGSGSSIGQIGGFGPMPPPPELVGYGNGRIPTAALEPIGQGNHRLYAPAAQAWKACVEAARADGIDLTITDSYRTFDQQVDLAQRKGLTSNGGYAATPGTSNHGWGLAVDADVTSPRTLDWMHANAWKFGYVEAVRARAVALGVPPTPGVARVTSGGFTSDLRAPAEVPCTITLAQIGQVPTDWDQFNPHTWR